MIKEATAPTTTSPPIVPPTMAPVLFDLGGACSRGRVVALGDAELDVVELEVVRVDVELLEELVKPLYVRSTFAVICFAAHPYSINEVDLGAG